MSKDKICWEGRYTDLVENERGGEALSRYRGGRHKWRCRFISPTAKTRSVKICRSTGQTINGKEGRCKQSILFYSVPSGARVSMGPFSAMPICTARLQACMFVRLLLFHLARVQRALSVERVEAARTDELTGLTA